MYYVYLLKNKKDRIYIGYSSDLRRRLKEHGKAWKLIYYEAYLAKKDAMLRERKLKDYGNSLAHLKKRLSNSL